MNAAECEGSLGGDVAEMTIGGFLLFDIGA